MIFTAKVESSIASHKLAKGKFHKNEKLKFLRVLCVAKVISDSSR